MAAPSTETTGKPHPYQYEGEPRSAKGAYEARKVRAGFYVRVDMPDVPDDTVKVVKYPETRTITFSGKAHKRWAGLDDETRIYGGYVVLDRDIGDVDFEYHQTHGCLRMLFKRCDGSLHFLSRHLPPSSSTPTVTIVQNEEEQTYTLEDETTGEDDEGTMPASFILHDPEDPSAICLAGGSPEHINLYQLSGVKGVYEHKIVTLGEGGDRMIYVRLDMPDTCDKTTSLVEYPDKSIIFSPADFQERVLLPL
ncbi:uncharacterized protein LOC141618231 [Silene latifolia]|uniref:uncharacterized protein LOC141618231 n=1 Tax=Silene latifolia TaxID=37657 RepID=UPI003D773997